MMAFYEQFRLRVCVSVTTAAILAAGFLINDPARAEDQASALVGSFSVAADVTGEIDERTGGFALQVPVVSLPGLVDSVNDSDSSSTKNPATSETATHSVGGFDVGLSYRDNTARTGKDRFGLGPWEWGITYINTDGGIHVHPASGGVFEADSSLPSGLTSYTLQDLVFTQKSGALPAHTNTTNPVPYTYTLSYQGGITDYFNNTGDLVTRIGLQGDRADLIWEPNHRLASVIDTAGNRTQLVWEETQIHVLSPTQQGNTTAHTVLHVTNNELSCITNPAEENISFTYQQNGVIQTIVSDTGTLTHVSYQTMPDNSVAVNQVEVKETSTGTILSTRVWKPVGEHLFTGWPTYNSEPQLWGSGDGGYQYKSVLSDGKTDVVSTYNSLGSLITRELIVSTQTGPVSMQTEKFVFPGTQQGGVPDPAGLPNQYAKPVEVNIIFSDPTGHTRTTTETFEYNTSGHRTRHVDSVGTLTETVFDTHIPEGMQLPVGLVLNETVTGADGALSRTVNTPTTDHKTVAASETFTGKTGGGLVSTFRVEQTVDTDGFLFETSRITTGSPSNNSPNTPGTVVTRFTREINHARNTVTLTETDAYGTDAQSSTSKMCDLSTGLIISATDPTGRVSSATYDISGRPLTQTSFAGLVTTIVYAQHVTRVTDPVGVTRSEYVDVLGRVVKITDNITPATQNVDPQQRGEVFGPVDGWERVVETRKYELDSSRIISTDGQGLETTTTLDVLGRPTRVGGPGGLEHITEYDDVANTKTVGVTSQGHGLAGAEKTFTTGKDSGNRDTQLTGSRTDGLAVPTQTTRFDGLGRVSEQVEGDVSVRRELNPDGTPRTTRVGGVLPGEQADVGERFGGQSFTVRRDHNFLGISTQKTLVQDDGDTQVGVSRVVDVVGRTVSETDQGGGVRVFEYTVDGLVSKTRNVGTGVTTVNTFDRVSRAVTQTETLAADGSVSVEAFEYDAVSGLLVGVCDPSDCVGTRVGYTYDVLGDMTSVVFADGRVVRFVFDQWGRKTGMVDVEGNVTSYVYDRVGLLVGAVQKTVGGVVLGEVGYVFDRFGRVKEVSRGNGVVTRFTFTSGDEVKTESTTDGGGQVVSEAAYRYDSHGNVVQRVQKHRNSGSGDGSVLGGVVEETTTYSYDVFNRLTGSSVYVGGAVSGQPRLRVGYEVNVGGDVTKETTTTNTNVGEAIVGGGSDGEGEGDSARVGDTEGSGHGGTVVREFEYNSLGFLLGVVTDGVRATQTYDGAGNLVRDVNGTTFSYNVKNQPVLETRCDGTRVETTYWVTGQNRTTTITGPDRAQETETAYWNNNTLINDTHTTEKGDDHSTVTASYLFGSSRLARSLTVRGNTSETEISDSYYYVKDRHGSVTHLTGNQGEVKETYTYTDYGQNSVEKTDLHDTSASANRPGATRNPFQYAGEYTTESGNQKLSFRTYDPSQMRFTTRDVAELHNRYAYANTNPITMVDPTGEKPGWDSENNELWTGVGILLTVLGFANTIPTGGASWGLTSLGIALAGVTDIGILTTQLSEKKYGTDVGKDMAAFVGLGLGCIATIAGAAFTTARFVRAGKLAEQAGELRGAARAHLKLTENLPSLAEHEAALLSPENDEVKALSRYRQAKESKDKAQRFLGKVRARRRELPETDLHGAQAALIQNEAGLLRAQSELREVRARVQQIRETETSVSTILAFRKKYLQEAEALDPASGGSLRRGEISSVGAIMGGASVMGIYPLVALALSRTSASTVVSDISGGSQW